MIEVGNEHKNRECYQRILAHDERMQGGIHTQEVIDEWNVEVQKFDEQHEVKLVAIHYFNTMLNT